MKYIYTFLTVFLLFACTSNKEEGNPLRFKYGTFEIPANDNYGKTIITRKDSIQIEKYHKKTSISTDTSVTDKVTIRIDTLFIKWKNNFAYSLRMKSPKTALDKDPIFVQITKVTDSSYSFTARIGYSNFKQKGTAYIKK